MRNARPGLPPTAARVHVGAMQDEILISVEPSPARRAMAVGVLAALGLLVLAVAFQGQGAPLFQATLIALGLGCVWAADRLRRATADAVELTRAGLRTRSGIELARVEHILRVDRSAFAFKPSQGFVVRLSHAAPRGWAPGLWWRGGRLLGIGGTVPGGQARAMADLLTALVAGHIPDDEPV